LDRQKRCRRQELTTRFVRNPHALLALQIKRATRFFVSLILGTALGPFTMS
jgi:hypothetical protein